MLCQACLVAYALLSGGNPDASVFSSPMVLEFGIGCGVAYLRSREYRRYAELALLIGMLGFAAGSIWIQRNAGVIAGLPRSATFGLGSAVVLYGLDSIELRGGLVFPRIVQRLGDASYSIYLWHLLIFTLLLKLMPAENFVTMFSRNAYGLFCLLVLLCVSFLSYHFLERPTIRMLNQWLARAHKRQWLGFAWFVSVK